MGQREIHEYGDDGGFTARHIVFAIAATAVVAIGTAAFVAFCLYSAFYGALS